ncbi:MAG: GGDEF domain-containing protein [Gammaproteobacteria bacterium]|nr:GGDEF domain-containing protein [Gammaproteobacteria bacterium]MDD9825084.1 GGDEF domain-containing protein [Gammaproteobacteria bacterium]MDD9864194.1 GGDEF domain-containing protein [Gammaproteobacteria bacterium]
MNERSEEAAQPAQKVATGLQDNWWLEQGAEIAERAPLLLAAIAGCALLAGMAIAPATNALYLLTWLLAVIAAGSGQWLLLQAQGSPLQGTPGRAWLAAWLALNTLQGCLWGGGFASLLLLADGKAMLIELQSLACLLLAIVSLAASACLSPLLPALLLFLSSALLPPCIVLILIAPGPPVLPLALFGLFLLLSFGYGWRFCIRLWRHGLASLRTEEALWEYRLLQQELEKYKREQTRLLEEKSKAEDRASQLTTWSFQDGLTKIANRRQFDEFLNREWRRAIRGKSPISLIMLDVDNFKLYNDRFGHQKGDLCLQQVAAVLQRFSRRGGDLAARYGGEEFAVILPEAPAAAGMRIAESIRQAVEKLQLPHPDTPLGVITVSLGVSTIAPPQPEDHPKQLLELADKALYQAKRDGKNRVA